MKYYQVVVAKDWANDKGFYCDGVISSGIVELNDVDDANPEYWWEDYCDGTPTSRYADDIQICVGIYSDVESYRNGEHPIRSWELWESNLLGPWKIRDDCLEDWGVTDPETVIDYEDFIAQCRVRDKDTCELIAEVY